VGLMKRTMVRDLNRDGDEASTAASRRYVVTRLDQPPLASAKAPSDVREVCISRGLTPIDLYNFDRSTPLTSVWAAGRSVIQLIACARRLAAATDSVVQYPLGRINEFALRLMNLGTQSVCLVHDLEMLRQPALAAREARTLGRFDAVIAHSEAMAAVIRAEVPNVTVVVLEAFDFLGAPPSLEPTAAPSCLYIFGNLTREKAGYVYEIEAAASGLSVEIYGPNCDVGLLPQGVHWNGLLNPQQPDLDTLRGFGLVWDGDSPARLAGPFGEYLKYNAPHKFSLYLALGIPVIAPTAAAVAPVVDRYGLGACVNSVQDALRFVETCPDSEWKRMVEAVREVQRRVQAGGFVGSALSRAGIVSDYVSDNRRNCE
jgi:hypothetical protein